MYYHVSSYIRPGQILTHATKNNYDYCCYVSTCEPSTYKEFLDIYQKLCLSNAERNSGRKADKWACEAIFDYVRRTEFPKMPSRIWGIYLTDSMEAAEEFLRTERDSQRAHIYEVQLPEKATVFSFDMDIFTKAHDNISENLGNESSYAFAIEQAREYWRSTGGKIIELLVDCDVLVRNQRQ